MQREIQDLKKESGDGFPANEFRVSLFPTLHPWHPRTHYQETSICNLIPGPSCVTHGRCTDDIKVKLWYANVQYHLCLGQLVSIWTPHLSSTKSAAMTLEHVSLATSIFPERDPSCHFAIQECKDDGIVYKAPRLHSEGKQLAGLMTLKNLITRGYEIADVKVLVCVKSIGERKLRKCSSNFAYQIKSDAYCKRAVTTKKETKAELVNVVVFDETFATILSLWGQVAASAASWEAAYTTLLISSPGLKSGNKPAIQITPRTQVDIDPLMADVDWLRKYAQRLTRKEHVNQPFSEGGTAT
ncbi:MAG: hypothetical protein Q9214_001151 [Letrouitia sp. 1 TL-2023]